MAETTHARSRRAALIGLVLQIITALAAFGLSRWVGSTAVNMLSLYLAGGIPIWFVVLLVFRQHELAALEAMDLDELRREKQATGGGEAIFDEGGSSGLGFMVAKTRLEWMQRWLIPIFGVLTAVYLITVGILAWISFADVAAHEWPRLAKVELGLVLVSLLMLFMFFFARYTSGMARGSGWQLLRGCGSYMLGNAAVALAVLVCLGVYLYQGTPTWERVLTYAIPSIMLLLGVETLINFLLDIYRPRTPGVEPRACFDSRLLGLISEPGGIAHSLAEAINYQFGFKVSQTWFYLLLQRAVVWLLGVGVVAVWGLSCLVVVQPYERVIVERFGAQLAPESPLMPGVHFKWPWPIDIARKYNTNQLHEVYVGYRDFDKPVRESHKEDGKAVIELWTDHQHGGRDHFDFIISPTPWEELEQSGDRRAESETSLVMNMDEGERAAQHIVRMVLVIQYKIDPERLVDFTQHVEDPHKSLKKIVWNEVIRFAASNHIDLLMGETRKNGGEVLRGRIAEQAAQLKLGLSIDFVGILQVHPTKLVAEAFRGVVTAQQEKIAKIREARVQENQILSRVAGDKRKAIALSHAVDQVQANELRRSELEEQLKELEALNDDQQEILDSLRSSMIRRLEAQWQLELNRQQHERILRDFELGLGGSLYDQARAEQAVRNGESVLAEATAQLETATQPIRSRLNETYDTNIAALLIDGIVARVALDFWNAQLEQDLSGLEGAAAVTLAQSHALRWGQEMRAAGEVTLLENERYAYNVAPEIYKARSYLQVLTRGIKDARKYFLAFEPGDRKVHIRLEAQEQAQTDVADMTTSMEP